MSANGLECSDPVAGGEDELKPDELRELLRVVKDPDLGLSILDLGLVYDVRVPQPGMVEVDMTLTTPGCPYGPQIVGQVHSTMANAVGVKDVHVSVVWDPPWSKDFISDAARLEMGMYE